MNLSKLGARLGQAESLQRGARITVTIGYVGNIEAQVIWTRDGLAGVCFDLPVDIERAQKRKAEISCLPASAGWAADLRNAYQN